MNDTPIKNLSKWNLYSDQEPINVKYWNMAPNDQEETGRHYNLTGQDRHMLSKQVAAAEMIAWWLVAIWPSVEVCNAQYNHISMSK